MDRSAGHSIQKRVNPLPFAQQHLGDLLQHPLLHPSPAVSRPCLGPWEVRVGAVFSVHAEAAQEVVLADGEFGGTIFEGLGVDGQAVVVDDGPTKGVAVKLILASFCQADLALEEDVFCPLLSLPHFLGFLLLGPPSCRPVSYYRFCYTPHASLAHDQLTNKNNINHHSFHHQLQCPFLSVHASSSRPSSFLWGVSGQSYHYYCIQQDLYFKWDGIAQRKKVVQGDQQSRKISEYLWKSFQLKRYCRR